MEDIRTWPHKWIYPGQNNSAGLTIPPGSSDGRRHLARACRTERDYRDTLPDGEKLIFDLYSELLKRRSEDCRTATIRAVRFVVPRNLWMPLNQMEGIQQGAGRETAGQLAASHRSDYEMFWSG